jgi:hypothetical protein
MHFSYAVEKLREFKPAAPKSAIAVPSSRIKFIYMFLLHLLWSRRTAP